jgi:hypothetical protein
MLMTWTDAILYRGLSIPLNLNSKVIVKKKMNVYTLVGFNGNLILESRYFDDERSERHFFPPEDKDSSIKIRDFNSYGYSLNLGIGSAFLLSKDTEIFSSIAYSIINHMPKDKYISGMAPDGTRANHSYLNLTIGISINNRCLQTLVLRSKYKKEERKKRCRDNFKKHPKKSVQAVVN